jgi:large conductance mechanosensitive channel
MGFVSEFKEFALKGNVVDMAVGIILGAAFSTIVKRLVDDIILPPIGLLTVGVDVAQLHWVIQDGSPTGSYRTLEAARQAGAITINYRAFLNSTIAFLIVALVLFLVVRQINRYRREAEDPDAVNPFPTSKTCPRCASSSPTKATKCPRCTSTLDRSQD